MKQRYFAAFVLVSCLAAAPASADEGRIEITGPTTIGDPGSYVLVNNVTGAIRIQASNVKLDLNGFTVSNSGPTTDGIVIGNYKNIEIANGTVTGFNRHGIFAPGGSTTVPNNIKLRNLNVTDNAISGISLENHAGFLIEGCAFSNNALGVYANGAGLVSNNVFGANKTGFVSYSNGQTGYRLNVFFNNGTHVSGSPMNLGRNNCGGVACP